MGGMATGWVSKGESGNPYLDEAMSDLERPYLARFVGGPWDGREEMVYPRDVYSSLAIAREGGYYEASALWPSSPTWFWRTKQMRSSGRIRGRWWQMWLPARRAAAQ